MIDFKAIKPDWEGYCNTMARNGEWVDNIVVTATAHLLQRDIVIVTSSPQGKGGAEPFTRISCRSVLPREPLLLGHVWESHYQSLQRIGMFVKYSLRDHSLPYNIENKTLTMTIRYSLNVI